MAAPALRHCQRAGRASASPRRLRVKRRPDSLSGSGPVYPQQQTCLDQVPTSGKCHEPKWAAVLPGKPAREASSISATGAESILPDTRLEVSSGNVARLCRSAGPANGRRQGGVWRIRAVSGRRAPRSRAVVVMPTRAPTGHVRRRADGRDRAVSARRQRPSGRTAGRRPRDGRRSPGAAGWTPAARLRPG